MKVRAATGTSGDEVVASGTNRSAEDETISEICQGALLLSPTPSSCLTSDSDMLHPLVLKGVNFPNVESRKCTLVEVKHPRFPKKVILGFVG